MNSRHFTKRQPSHRAVASRRRAAVLFALIVCVALASLLLVAIARQAVARRRLIDMQAQRLQATWLAESALERAAAQFQANPDFRDETWTIPAEQFDGTSPAVVRIILKPIDDKPTMYRVHVVADYPNDGANRARVEKDIMISDNR